jgi:hypothetical protein
MHQTTVRVAEGALDANETIASAAAYFQVRGQGRRGGAACSRIR